MPKRTLLTCSFIMLALLVGLACGGGGTETTSDKSGSPSAGSSATPVDDPTSNTSAGRIAFVASSPEALTLYTVREDGSDLQEVAELYPTRRPGKGSVWLAWSPDGETLAAAPLQRGRGTVSLIRSDGSVSEVGKGGEEVGGLEWAPDGSRIVYTALRDGALGIYVAEVGGEEVLLANLVGDSVAGRVDWSPDGSRIAYRSDDAPSGGGIYSVPSAGGSPALLVPHGGKLERVGEPAWSPDGTQLAFIAGGFNGGTYVANADGSNARRLTTKLGFTGPKWSPDGKTLVWCELAGVAFDIFSIRADGSDLRRLDDNVGFDCLPVWSPDGSRIAYASESLAKDCVSSLGKHTGSNLSVFNADGSAIKCLVGDLGILLNGGIVALAWSPAR